MNGKEYCKYLKKSMVKALKEKGLCRADVTYDYEVTHGFGFRTMRVYRNTDEDLVKYLLGTQRQPYSRYKKLKTKVAWLFRQPEERCGMILDIFSHENTSLHFALEDFLLNYLSVYGSRFNWGSRRPCSGRLKIVIYLQGEALKFKYKILDF